jgi:GDPmannose 4,6-dehydratase
MKALLTGITGQDGSFLAELLLEKGYEVHGIVRRSSSFNTGRLDHILGDLQLHYGDMTDSGSLCRIIQEVRPDECFNLAAQSHVRTSFENPEYTADTDALGTLRLIEACRANSVPKFYQASTSELFGMTEAPQRETTPFYPRSPYGIAKLFAYWTVVNYRESYDMFACNGILFNHECITEETPVMIRKNGIIDIKEIQDVVTHRQNPEKGKKYQTIPKNLEVWDGTNWTKVTCCTATWNDGKKKVLSVEARGGLYKATTDHISFLEGRKQIKTEDLRRNDRIQLYPLPQSSEKTSSVHLDEAKLLGLLCGDGYVCSDGGSARFTNLDKLLRDKASDLFIKITGGNTREDHTKYSGYTSDIVPSVEFSNASAFFQKWRSELYDERGKKKIPIRILNSTKEVQSAFLSGYNDADGLKAGYFMNREFKSFKTNSAALAQGLCFLSENLGYRLSVYMDREYYSINVGLKNPQKGKHLQKPLEQIRKISKVKHVGWLFDLATKSSTFSAGVGRTWIHNSPRRGENFVTLKIARGLVLAYLGKQKEIVLGNLEARRDWGYAKEFVEAMWLMMQQNKPDDFVIATGESHTVREFLDEGAHYLGIDWEPLVKIDPRYFRPTEVDYLLGDASKAKRILGWEPRVKFKELVRLMIDAELAAQESV